MGYAKLNIWLRDEKCRPYKIQTATPGDTISITNCMDGLVEKVVVPVGEAHVEVEVAPGCYIVQGYVCEPQPIGNEFTDKAMVIAGCNQELCVNLIVPTVRTCVKEGLNAFVRAARFVRVPEHEIRIMAKTMLKAGGISKEEMVENIASRAEVVKEIKGAEQIVKDYNATLDVIRG